MDIPSLIVPRKELKKSPNIVIVAAAIILKTRNDTGSIQGYTSVPPGIIYAMMK
eukprot:XP_001710135.1 Hypothetical protein GL50803_32726 [Giardia lamblia ATCC 50803]